MSQSKITSKVEKRFKVSIAGGVYFFTTGEAIELYNQLGEALGDEINTSQETEMCDMDCENCPINPDKDTLKLILEGVEGFVKNYDLGKFKGGF